MAISERKKQWRKENPEKVKEYDRRYYLSSTKKREGIKARRVLIAKMLSDAKDGPCVDCDKTYPSYVMDLDHRDPQKKETNPAHLVRRAWSIERVKNEIEKCDLVCANCHRERTHGPKCAG